MGDVGDGGIVSRLDGAPARALVETSGVAFTRDALLVLERERPEAVVGPVARAGRLDGHRPSLEEAL